MYLSVAYPFYRREDILKLSIHLIYFSYAQSLPAFY